MSVSRAKGLIDIWHKEQQLLDSGEKLRTNKCKKIQSARKNYSLFIYTTSDLRFMKIQALAFVVYLSGLQAMKFYNLT